MSNTLKELHELDTVKSVRDVMMMSDPVVAMMMLSGMKLSKLQLKDAYNYAKKNKKNIIAQYIKDLIKEK
ncbi:MAG: hypothetical protein VKL60_00395 [Sphaerospermopsis sp.]|nr:hypothetical protein [Sphaerospermopsis sp.]